MKKYHKIQTVFKRDPENRHKTLLEGDFSLPEFEYLAKNDWVYTEKVDGCLHYGSTVLTDIGRIPIGRIVEKKMSVNVLSYNENTGIVEFKKIKHYHKEKRLRDFLSVTVKSKVRGNRPKRIVCTDNHKFLSCGSWIEAKNLKPGQSVSHLIEQIPYGIKHIIVAGLSADSSIYRPSETTRGFGLIHSVKQNGYFEFKKMLLGDLFNECKGSQGGFSGSLPNRRGNSVVNRAISDFIIKYCEKNGKKQITRQWADELSPLGIAIWYMDDGSVDFNESQRPRVRFATNAYSKEEVNLLKDMFLTKFNIECKVANYNGLTLCLTADGSEKLFNLIFPYICDSMKYKLPKEYMEYPCVLTKSFDAYLSIVDTIILDISNNLPKNAKGQQQYQYDLSIEDNSNYFTNSVLVHNTNIRIMWDGHFLTFGGKTDNAQIPSTLVNNLSDMFTWDKMNECFSNTPVCLYGEGYGKKIQKGGGNYNSDTQDFVLFDILIDGWWLKRSDVTDIAKKLNIRVVPIIDVGSLWRMVDMVRVGFNSQWGDFLAEGIVARPKIELSARNDDRIITKIKYKDFAHKP